MINRFFSYLLVIFFVAISYLPLRLLYVFSDFFYFVIYYLIGYRKEVVKMNLRNSFPDKSSEELLQIEKKFFHHLADLFVEVIKLRTMSLKEIDKRCKMRNLEIIKELNLQNKSVICIQGHYCNWEWVTHIDRLIPQKILSVYKPLHNQVEDEYMKKIREHFGAMTVSKNHILRVLARRQKANKLSAVGLLSDQVPNNNKATYWMPFLNQDTPVFLGAEKMAKMFDLPVFFMYARKLKRGYYEIEFIPVTTEPKEEENYAITEKHVRLVEKMIQEEPAYWLWSHKRWKHKRRND